MAYEFKTQELIDKIENCNAFGKRDVQNIEIALKTWELYGGSKSSAMLENIDDYDFGYAQELIDGFENHVFDNSGSFTKKEIEIFRIAMKTYELTSQILDEALGLDYMNSETNRNVFDLHYSIKRNSEKRERDTAEEIEI